MLADDDCIEILVCPGCGHVDVDFEFIEYRRVRCSLEGCRAFVRVTHYKVFMRCAEHSEDIVEYHGEAESAAK